MGSQIHIVADENIGLVEDFFAPLGAITLLRGNAIVPSNLRDADVLLVRSVTKVNSYLLSDCPRLHFVGSATSGTDHVDEALLASRGIQFAHAPGSNAQSVAEYVLCATIRKYRSLGTIAGLKVGVVGIGQIGSRVARMFKSLGCSVIANDPPMFEGRTETADEYVIADLHTLLASSDVVSIHVPLTTDGRWPTNALIDSGQASTVRPGSLFINTSRGEVVTQSAIELLQQSSDGCVLDVWPGEPSPDKSIVEHAYLATPHIAGYSYDGKIRGTQMLRDALVQFLGAGSPLYLWNKDVEVPEFKLHPTHGDEFANAIRSMYSIEDDDRRFREAYLTSTPDEMGSVFARLRRHYPTRRSFDAFENQWHGLSEPTQCRLREIVRLLIAE